MGKKRKARRNDKKKVEQKTARMTNAEFAATNTEFQDACRTARGLTKTGQMINPTTRQASKYRRKMGSAYFFAFAGTN